MINVLIDYDLGRHGWSSFKLTVADKTLVIGAFGYCTDALGDLVRAALLVATSANSAEVCFDGEPYTWRLRIDENWKLEPILRVEGDGELLLESRITADEFARAVQKTAQQIWDTYKAQGYNEAWAGDRGFPLRALRALDAALSCEEPLPPREELKQNSL